VWRDRTFTYAFLHSEAADFVRMLADVPRGAVVSLEADYTPRAIAALLALIEREAIVVPVTPDTADMEGLLGRAEVELRLAAAAEETAVAGTGARAGNALYRTLRATAHPGLVLFSSGSAGPPKGVVHDLTRLTARYERPGRQARICAFLALDHIGGLNTLLYTLANGGCLIVPDGRLPDLVCSTIESHRVEVLPTTPTFLGLLLLSDACERHDLSSLELVTYGTEVMPPPTLERLRARLPRVRLLQTYGLSETGILATRSPDQGDVWFAITAPDVETRIVDGILHVRARSTMLGYLDGPSRRLLPGGWFDTGDVVECRGGLIRVVGRASDVINVGGQKVHAAEVESVVLELEGVAEARATAEANALTGQHVRLDVVLTTAEPAAEFRRRLRRHCSERVDSFKIPQRVVVTSQPLHGPRYKKTRPASGA
jgi:long-chain acyl-CoA synthetase